MYLTIWIQVSGVERKKRMLMHTVSGGYNKGVHGKIGSKLVETRPIPGFNGRKKKPNIRSGSSGYNKRNYGRGLSKEMDVNKKDYCRKLYLSQPDVKVIHLHEGGLEDEYYCRYRNYLIDC